MNKLTAVAAGLAGFATLAVGTVANAQQDRLTDVAPITCIYSTSCVLDYNGNPSGQGYWMARQSSGSTWVRLTLVAGWTTTGIPPITCAEEDSCVVTYVPNGGTDGYYMARQDADTPPYTWVRLTLVQGL